MTDHVFEVGQRVRYTLDTDSTLLPVLGTKGTITRVQPASTGTLYAIDWDGDDLVGTPPQWFAAVLEPIE